MKNLLSMATKVMVIVMVIAICNTMTHAAAKNDLVNRFAEILKFKADYLENQRSNSDTKITSLFVRSAEKNSIDLTMLIAYNRSITSAARSLTNDRVTPLILSVSTMPFVETNFQPSDFTFEQDGYRWSPGNNEKAFDMFPLGEDASFGGAITENDVQQGVILLPGSFDVNKPIKISYKNFKKVCMLR
ncbi:hypothetical protein GF337_06325 [candidate division KSB1 bacterium]|nr:hypothetical protein [candidate division KSB1 bacterium]